MSVSNALQTLIFQRLTGASAVTALVAQRVYDHPPKDAVFPYLSFGASDSVPDDADCITGRIETLQIDIWSRAQDGKREAKAITDAVKTALHRWTGNLSVGALSMMEVTLSRVIDDPDGETSHGIVQVECHIEDDVS
jgi:hypothetical protein